MANPVTAAGSPVPIPSGDELYDMLMGQIEKELTSAELPLLEERYKNETKEEATARAARYAKAFELYDECLEEYLKELRTTLHANQRMAMAGIEQDARDKEATRLAALESSISAE